MDILAGHLATKTDLIELKNEMGILKTSLQSEIQELKTSLQSEMDEKFLMVDHRFETLEFKLLFKLGALMILIQGAFVTLAKYL